MTSPLTVIVPLKDRSAFTSRLMSYFSKTNFPFKVILADGGSDAELEHTLRSGEYYGGVNYRYIRYPYDDNLTQFHKKLDHCANEVDTPFVVSIDNDDFLTLEGLEKSISFLRNNPDYSSCRGALIGFPSPCQGFPNRSDLSGNMYTEFPDDITGASAADRVIDQSAHFHGNWHNLTRSHHYKATHKILKELDPQGFRFTEQTIGFLGVIWGNSSRNDYEFILHQHGTDRVLGCERLPSQANWISDVGWPENFAKMTDAIAVGISSVDEIDLQEAREIFKHHYESMYTKRVPGYLDTLSEAIESSTNFYRQDLQGLVENIRSLVM